MPAIVLLHLSSCCGSWSQESPPDKVLNLSQRSLQSQDSYLLPSLKVSISQCNMFTRPLASSRARLLSILFIHLFIYTRQVKSHPKRGWDVDPGRMKEGMAVLSLGVLEMERARARQIPSLENPTHHRCKAHHSSAVQKQKVKPDPAMSRQPILG